MKRYHHVEQGRGEHLQLPNTINGIPYDGVGTYNCQACLCLYVRFSDDSVFIAHMYAQDELRGSESTSPTRSVDAGTGSDDEDWMWKSDPEKGRQLKERVLVQLNAEKWADRRYDAQEAFAVCPSIALYGSEANGWWIKEAIEEFFEPTPVTLQVGHGFIAAPGTPTVELGLTSGEDDQPQVHGWEPVERVLTRDEWDLQPNKGKWGFIYLDGEWIR